MVITVPLAFLFFDCLLTVFMLFLLSFSVLLTRGEPGNANSESLVVQYEWSSRHTATETDTETDTDREGTEGGASDEPSVCAQPRIRLTLFDPQGETAQRLGGPCFLDFDSEQCLWWYMQTRVVRCAVCVRERVRERACVFVRERVNESLRQRERERAHDCQTVDFCAY